MRILRSSLLVLIAMLIAGNIVAQQDTTSKSVVKLSGDAIKPMQLTNDVLKKLKRISVSIQNRDKVEQLYSGYAIQDILEAAGAPVGKKLRGENLTAYLLVKCADGYEVLFSLAELDDSFTNRVVILADEMGGASLPNGKGPYRLVVPGDKIPARSTFQVVELVVSYAK